MMQLTDEQLNDLNKEALVIITSSMQSQLVFMQEQLSLFESFNEVEATTHYPRDIYGHRTSCAYLRFKR